jgi:hypothetical protein
MPFRFVASVTRVPLIAQVSTRNLQDHPLRQCAKRLRVKAERLLKNITDRKDRSNPPIPSDLPGRTPSTILIKPNGINGHSRSQSGTPVPPLFPTKSTIRIPPSTLSKKKKSKDISFPESPAIIRTAEGMRLFKAADEELDDEESNVENRLREFTLEDPDEFVDLESEEETALTGDKRKPYGGVYTWCTRLANTTSSGTARVQKGRGNGPDDHHPRLGSRGLIYGGRSCNATSLWEVVTLLCGTLPPTQMVRPHSPPPHRRMYKLFKPQILGGSDGRKYRRRIRMLPIRHSSD